MWRKVAILTALSMADYLHQVHTCCDCFDADTWLPTLILDFEAYQHSAVTQDTPVCCCPGEAILVLAWSACHARTIVQKQPGLSHTSIIGPCCHRQALTSLSGADLQLCPAHGDQAPVTQRGTSKLMRSVLT